MLIALSVLGVAQISSLFWGEKSVGIPSSLAKTGHCVCLQRVFPTTDYTVQTVLLPECHIDDHVMSKPRFDSIKKARDLQANDKTLDSEKISTTETEKLGDKLLVECFHNVTADLSGSVDDVTLGQSGSADDVTLILSGSADDVTLGQSGSADDVTWGCQQGAPLQATGAKDKTGRALPDIVAVPPDLLSSFEAPDETPLLLPESAPKLHLMFPPKPAAQSAIPERQQEPEECLEDLVNLMVQDACSKALAEVRA